MVPRRQNRHRRRVHGDRKELQGVELTVDQHERRAAVHAPAAHLPGTDVLPATVGHQRRHLLHRFHFREIGRQCRQQSVVHHRGAGQLLRHAGLQLSHRSRRQENAVERERVLHGPQSHRPRLLLPLPALGL